MENQLQIGTVLEVKDLGDPWMMASFKVIQ